MVPRHFCLAALAQHAVVKKNNYQATCQLSRLVAGFFLIFDIAATFILFYHIT